MISKYFRFKTKTMSHHPPILATLKIPTNLPTPNIYLFKTIAVHITPHFSREVTAHNLIRDGHNSYRFGTRVFCVVSAEMLPVGPEESSLLPGLWSSSLSRSYPLKLSGRRRFERLRNRELISGEEDFFE